MPAALLRTSPGRLVAWAALLLVWVTLTTLSFRGAADREHEHGNPLGNAELILAEKYASLAQLPALRSSPLLDTLKLEEAWTHAVSQHPDDAGLRLRAALVLASLGRLDDARHALPTPEKLQATRPPAPPRGSSASQRGSPTEAGAPAPGKSAGSPAEVKPTAADLDAVAGLIEQCAHPEAKPSAPGQRIDSLRKQTRTLTSGWLADWADARWASLLGQADEARQAQERLTAQATINAAALVILGCAVVGEFVLGLVLVLIVVTRGSDMQLRCEVPDAGCTWSALQGFSSVVFWQVSAGVLHVLAMLAGLQGLGVTLVVQGILYAGVLWLVAELCKKQWHRVGLHAVSLGRSILVGACGLFVNFIAVAAIALLLSQLRGQAGPSSNPVFSMMHAKPSLWLMVGLGLLVAAVGPFFEEVLFRGVLFASLRERLGPTPAALLSGLIFALVHADLNSLGPLFVMGTLLALLYHRTGSLWTSFTTHLLWNGQVFVATLFLFS